MRGRQDPQVPMLTLLDVDGRVPVDHPLRTIKVLAELSPEFDAMYAEIGRPSIPPERLLKASLVIALYSVRNERAFPDLSGLDYNLLFRWFLHMNLLEASFDPTVVLTKNRERLLQHEVGRGLFNEVLVEAHARGLLSDEHFTVDGTLIEAAASLKSFKRKDGGSPPAADGDPSNPTVDFHGGEAEQRHPPEHHGRGGPPVPEGEGEGGQAGLHGPCPDGEPERHGGGLPGDGGHGDGGAGRRAGAGGGG
ncbi:MAG: transposase, partial [Chloroflexi bacterium]|nr:transposase [Chloroflexota bacterium]